jgi:RNA polymerase sigma-70 factor (ECF subfamily)
MNDIQLVNSCLQGEVDEFRKIVEKYREKVMALAMNVLGNRQDAEDACQETFIHIYRSLDTFDTARSFRSWIYAILFNLCRDHLRKRQRFFKFFKRAKAESLPPQRSQASDYSSHQYFQRGILKNLTPKERAALYLWAAEGYTSEETGRVLECSASTARVHLYNARKKIKAVLEEENVSM